MREVLVLCALAAVLGHVCATDVSGHAAAATALAAGPVNPLPSHHSAIHAASCDGLKPGSVGPASPSLESRPVAGLLALSAPRSQGAPPACRRAPGPPLFVLHAALLV